MRNNSNSLQKKEFERLVDQKVQEILPQAVRQLSITKTEIFSGPIPSPQHCEGYEKIIPGFTDRALKIAEKAQDSDIKGRIRADRFTLLWRMTGLICLTLIALTVVIGGVWLLSMDKNIAGFAVIITAAGSLIAAIRGASKSENRGRQ